MPTGPVTVPEVVRELAGGDPVEPVWRNELGGLTFRVAAGTARDRYVKWVAVGTPEIDLVAEAERLRWARPWVVVPEVRDAGADDRGSWLVTTTLAGRSAVDGRWLGAPEVVVPAIGRGLRVLHDALPVPGCPFGWSVEARQRRVEERIAEGGGPDHWSPEHRTLTVADARARLADPPAVDDPVVCHGDACAPNTLVDDAGDFAGHVDLGSLGVADRWADLAVAAWSTEWNYGPGHDQPLYRAYGVAEDTERVAYYRLLWDLG